MRASCFHMPAEKIPENQKLSEAWGAGCLCRMRHNQPAPLASLSFCFSGIFSEGGHVESNLPAKVPGRGGCGARGMSEVGRRGCQRSGPGDVRGRAQGMSEGGRRVKEGIYEP